MQLEELDKKDIDKIPLDLKKKVLQFHEGNIAFCKAIENNDLNVVKSLLDKEYPMSFSVFSQEDQYLIGDNISDTWSNNIHYIAFFVIHKHGIKKENQDLRDLMAEYWMYQRSTWYYLRKIYFSCSNNVQKSLSYAQHLYESMNFLHGEKSEWITGAMCHPDDNFFDDFFDIHNKSKRLEQIFSPLSKSANLYKSDNVSYNFNSWCKYYNYYFEDAVEEKLNRPYYNTLKDYTQDDAIKELFSELYQGFDVTKDVQFIDFLNSEYDNFFDISNPDLIKVSLAWTRKKEHDVKEHLRAITSRRRSGFRMTDKTEENLISVISHAIQNNCPDECEQAFKKIKLENSYYKHLSNYLQLNTQLNIKSLPMEKVQKI